MLTTVIGAYPKPDYLKITDWFNAKGGTDTANPTKLYEDEINIMGSDAETIFKRAAQDVIKDLIPIKEELNEINKNIDNLREEHTRLVEEDFAAATPQKLQLQLLRQDKEC